MSNPIANVKPSARVRLAARLYATGACKTKREASTAAGLHPNYLTILTGPKWGSREVKRLVNEIDEKIADQTIQMSAIIELMGRRAIGKIGHLMESNNENIALKAAQDLADRAPQTSKTQRLQVDSFSISGHDVAALASALVESSQSRREYEHVARDGLIEITDLQLPVREGASNAKESSSKQEEPGTTAEEASKAER